MSQPIVEKAAGPPKISDDDGEKRKREYKDFGHDDVPKATRVYSHNQLSACSYPYLDLILDAHVDMSRVRLIRLLFQRISYISL
jgi:hypothetical protein